MYPSSSHGLKLNGEVKDTLRGDSPHKRLKHGPCAMGLWSQRRRVWARSDLGGGVQTLLLGTPDFV